MSTRLEFDDFQLDTDEPALYQAGGRVEIAAQPLRLLVLLASRHGEVVSHAEISRHLWGERIVDFPNGLHVCIRQIRVALKDSPSSPRYLQNVPRVGYRFMGDVSEPAATTASPPRKQTALRYTYGVTALAVLAVAGWTLQASPPLDDVANTAEESPRAVLDAYRRGRFLLDSGKPDAIGRSRAFLNQAIDLDPTFAPAFAAMAESYQLEGQLERARPYALEALRLDKGLPEAHLRVAAVAAFGDWNWTLAEDSARIALSLAPDSAEAYHAMATIYSVTGRMDHAVEAMRDAMALDPASTLLHADYGMYLYYQGDLVAAEQECADALRLDPQHYPSKLCVYKVAIERGDVDVAMQHANDIVARWASQDVPAPEAELPATPAGIEAFERWRLRYYRHTENESAVSPVAYALVHAALGEHEQVLDYLEQAVQLRASMAPFVLADPVFDKVRGYRRFKNVLRSMNVQAATAASFPAANGY